ncbi:MAG TPA: porphobilinogen synthase [Candidatus Bathyarchaeia archaeon]|nr:porphobilinogen synthase [Candidatus Bathyarchaeia archaeon]
MRRLRRTSVIRELVREVQLQKSDLIQPLFLEEDLTADVPISTMPGQRRLSPSSALGEVSSLVERGIKAVILFGIPRVKDETGSSADLAEGVVQRAVRELKDELGKETVVMADVCMCQYTNHGHCGIVRDGEIDNDETLKRLASIAVSYAREGADVVGPSAMIDGQVKAIRHALDDHGFKDTAIMAYAAKHASTFFGPFREAAFSAPEFGDRRSYQMDYSNPDEALREVALDIQEGADMVMVKPALSYLDIIHRVKQRFAMPTAAYNVSGEFAMVKAAAREGWIDEKSAVLEILTSIKRAGADMILTYHAKEASEWLG